MYMHLSPPALCSIPFSPRLSRYYSIAIHLSRRERGLPSLLHSYHALARTQAPSSREEH